jgi:hypothetical protein
VLAEWAAWKAPLHGQSFGGLARHSGACMYMILGVKWWVSPLAGKCENAMLSSGRLAKSAIFRPHSVLILFAAMLFVAGCGTSCFVGIINPPNNSLTLPAGTLPPVCSSSQPMAALKVVGSMAAACTDCATAQEWSHAYLYLGGIELHPGTVADENSPDWQELAPDLGQHPRFIDLIENAQRQDMVLPLEVTGDIPSGTYYQLRLHLARVLHSESQTEELSAANRCAVTARANCLVNADNSNHVLRTLDGDEFLSVQMTVPLEVRVGHLNQIRIQFRPEWLLQRNASGAIELSPVLHGEVVVESVRALQVSSYR